MLTKPSVLAANDLAKRITSAGIKLRSKPGTLLDELQVHTSCLINTSNVDDVPGALQYLTPEIHASGPYTQTNHDNMMDSYIADLATIVASHVSFIKGTVNKQVTLFKDELTQAYNGLKISTPEEAFNITYFQPHEIFFCDELANEMSVSAASTVTSIGPADTLNVSKVNPEEYPVEKYLLVGDEQFDTMILSWMQSVGLPKITSYIYAIDARASMDIDQDLSYSLANYLFYRNLTEKLDINFGLTTIQLRTRASTLRNEFLRRLKSYVDLYRTFINKGSLLLPSSDVRFRDVKVDEYLNITIFNDTYKTFVEKGGSLETILGFVAATNSYDATIAGLLEQQGSYLDLWKNVRTMFILKSNADKLSRFKTAINLSYDKTNATLDDGEKEARLAQRDYDKTVNTALNKYLETVQTSNIDDLDTVAITVIAGIRFFYTNAFAYLMDMHNIMKMSDNIPVDEAALFAALNYTAEFAVGQAYIMK